MVVMFTRQERAAVERGARDTARALSLAVDRDLLRSMTALEALATSKALDTGELRGFEREARRVLPTQDGWLDKHPNDDSKEPRNLRHQFNKASRVQPGGANGRGSPAAAGTSFHDIPSAAAVGCSRRLAAYAM